jgi:DnaJ-class molecular chaperone
MRKAAAAAAVALTAAASTSEATSSISVTPNAPPFALYARGGASFQDNDKTTSQPEKGKKKRRKSTKRPEKPSREETETSKSPSEEEEEVASSAAPSPQEALVEQLLKEDDYYAILGVSKSATAQEIQKAYRRRAVQTHPDKLPSSDRRAFDKVAEAYDVLSDDTKRATYNRFGKRGLDSTAEGRPPSSFTEDIFKSFFGTNPYRQQQPRNRTVRYQLEVTLEELYNGTLKHVIVTEPGRKKVELSIERGMASGQSIVLSGEMDHMRDATPADLVFELQQRPHPQFTRRGHDLAMELTISLQEAICGLTRSVRHLDGRVIAISSARHVFSDASDTAMLIQTGDVHVLKGEGMPKPGQVDSFGDLYVQYRVEMPSQKAVNSLTSDEREHLETLLGKLDGNVEKVNKKDKNVRLMQKASPADFGRASGPFRLEEENEETDRRHRQFHFSNGSSFSFGGFGGRPSFDNDDPNVQCQQM